MNKKTLQNLLMGFGVLFLSVSSGYAQSTHYSNNEDRHLAFGDTDTTIVQDKKLHNAYKTTWLKNRFKDTWFVTFGSGAQILMAEDDDKGSFSSRITYAPTFTIGKYFSPIWGLKIQFTGGSLHGFNDGRDGFYRKWNSGGSDYLGEAYKARLIAEDPIRFPDYQMNDGNFATWDPSWHRRGFSILHHNDVPNGIVNEISGTGKAILYHAGNKTYMWEGGAQHKLYMQHVRYVATNINFMFDFLTLVGNYNPKRPFEITPYAGITYAHVFPSEGQSSFDTFGVNGGFDFRFRLSNKFDFSLGGSLTMYPEEFDGHYGDNNPFDLVAQTTAGITYHIGKSTWDVVEPMDYNRIRKLNDIINDQRRQLDNIPPCPDCPACPEPEPVKEEKIIFLPDPVFFRIDKSVIDNSEWSKIEKAAKYLNENPNAKVIVTGYADKETAYPAYNLRLSERRSKVVSKALIEKYRIAPQRVSIQWEGDKIQPFEINEWNRVVIFVIDK